MCTHDALESIGKVTLHVRSFVRSSEYDVSAIAPIEVTTLGRAGRNKLLDREKSSDILQRPPAGEVGRPLRNKT